MTINVLIYSTGQDTGGQGTRLKHLLETYPLDPFGGRLFKVRSAIVSPTYIDYPTDLIVDPISTYGQQAIRDLFEWADILHLRHNLVPLTMFGSGVPKPTILHSHSEGYFKNHARLTEKCDRLGVRQVVSGIELQVMEPAKATWLPQPHDVSYLQTFAEAERVGHPKPRRRKGRPQAVHIVHCPTRASKGTAYVEAAINQLMLEGFPITFDLVQGVSWEECLRRKAQADIFIDQVGPLGFGYGNNAIEAWSMGIPVISEAPDPTAHEAMLNFYGGQMPFLEATAPTEVTLPRQLAALVNSTDLRKEFAQRGYEHVRKYHDYPAVAKLLEEIYLFQPPTIAPPAVKKQRLQRPDASVAAAVLLRAQERSRVQHDPAYVPMNVLIYAAGADTAGQGYRMKRAIEAAALGAQPKLPITVRSAHITDHSLGFPSDIKATRQSSPELFHWADVIHMQNSLVVLDRYGHSGQPTFLHHHGSAYRKDHALISAVAREMGVRELVSTLDLELLEPNLTWLPQPIDLDELHSLRSIFYEQSATVRIAHAPTDRKIKSTEILISVVEAMQELGLPVSLDLIEGVPQSVCLQRKAAADIYVDQLILGYGANAVESWGLGLPVVAGVLDERVEKHMRQRFGGELPFFQSSEASLAHDLADLVKSAALRSEFAARGLEYVRTWHDQRIVGNQLISMYKSQPRSKKPGQIVSDQRKNAAKQAILAANSDRNKRLALLALRGKP